MTDPLVTDPGLYQLLFENDRVRVLQYRDHPGDATHAHSHPDSVMITLSSFRRVITAGGRDHDVALDAHQVRWVDAQEHQGLNVGDTDTHSIFIELKESRGSATSASRIGPSTS